MSDSVQMPALGESVTEGTVTRWLKQVGDRVEVDEPLLEVSTDKVDTEIPSPVAGVVEKILVSEDETVDVGAELAVIGDGSSAEGGSDASDDQPEESGEQESGGQGQQDEAGDDERPDEAGDDERPDEAGDDERPDEPAKDEGQAGGDSQGASGGGSGGGTPVTMPALGESVTEGTVTRWLKQEGDSVEVDEPLLEVSTDKVDTEIPSPVAGVVRKILVGEDETVEVGAELAMVGGDDDPGDSGDSGESGESEESDEDDAAGDLAAEEQEHERAAEQSETKSQPERAEREPEPKQPEPKQPQKEKQATSEGSQGAGRSSGDSSSYVTPLVRKLAAEHDVELSSLSGTGVGGRIRKQDVLAAAEKAKAAKAEPDQPEQRASSGGELPAGVAAQRGTSEKMTRLRKVIAQRMVESLQVSAQLTTVVEVDVSKIARLRDRAKRDFEAREGVKLSFLPFFAKASVEALGQHPKVNASLEDDQIVYHAQENLGIAVDTDRGLLVPVIRDAGDLNIAGLSRKISDLAARTRSSKIAPDELGGGTFTLTNTGSRGALFDTPIINQPQVAILGTGAVVRRPVVVKDADGGETIAIRSMAYLALSYDHRLVDGADAARFLVTIKDRLEEGAFEGDLGL